MVACLVNCVHDEDGILGVVATDSEARLHRATIARCSAARTARLPLTSRRNHCSERAGGAAAALVAVDAHAVFCRLLRDAPDPRQRRACGALRALTRGRCCWRAAVRTTRAGACHGWPPSDSRHRSNRQVKAVDTICCVEDRMACRTGLRVTETTSHNSHTAGVIGHGGLSNAAVNWRRQLLAANQIRQRWSWPCSAQAILTSVEAKDEYGAPLQVNQACYAAVGAAAVLAGVRRRMLSAAVIVMETTASLHAKSPILFAVFFAK
eukprot:356348-Chlamydomonas_euryale.AAC.29